MKTYPITFPDPITDADGVEYEPTGEWRCPKKGEWFLLLTGIPCESSWDYKRDCHPILRPIWRSPAGMQGWIAKNQNGTIRWHATEPEVAGGGMYWWSRLAVDIATLQAAFPSLTPPPIPDWRVPVRCGGME